MSKISTMLKSGLAASMLLASAGIANAAYPAAGSFDGEYGFTAESFNFNEEYKDYGNQMQGGETDYSLYFMPEFNFSIQTKGSTIMLYDFPYKDVGFGIGNANLGQSCEYDQSTGILTLSQVSYRPDINGVYFGIAPNGEWGGISALYAKKMTFQIGEDGSISIPNFEMVRYNGNTKGEVVVSYADITVGEPHDLGSGPDPEKPDPSDGKDYSYMEGVWTFPDLWSFASQGLVRNDEKEPPTYDTTVSGSTIYFGDNGSGFNMIGWIIDDTTIRFRFRAVGNPAIYTYYQCPFIDNTITQSNFDDVPLDKEVTFDATFDLATRTISFPAGTGLRFGAFNSVGKLANNKYEEAFRFDGPATWSPFLPSMSLYVDIDTGMRVSTTENAEGDILVKVPIRFQHWDNSLALTYKATILDHYQDNDLEEDWDEISTFDATIENGYVVTTIYGYTPGNHDFSIIITAYDAAGQVYATSNQKDFTFVVTVDTSDKKPQPDPDQIDLYLIGENYGDWNTVEADYKFTCEGNVYTLELDSLEGEWKIWDGSWDFNFGCGASQPTFNREANSYFFGGNFKLNSEIPVIITFTLVEGSAEKNTSIASRILISRDESDLNGIEGIEAETGAIRYFNLQGVEIAEPTQGLYIKVQGGKTEKILK